MIFLFTREVSPQPSHKPQPLVGIHHFPEHIYLGKCGPIPQLWCRKSEDAISRRAARFQKPPPFFQHENSRFDTATKRQPFVTTAKGLNETDLKMLTWHYAPAATTQNCSICSTTTRETSSEIKSPMCVHGVQSDISATHVWPGWNFHRVWDPCTHHDHHWSVLRGVPKTGDAVTSRKTKHQTPSSHYVWPKQNSSKLLSTGMLASSSSSSSCAQWYVLGQRWVPGSRWKHHNTVTFLHVNCRVLGSATRSVS